MQQVLFWDHCVETGLSVFLPVRSLSSLGKTTKASAATTADRASARNLFAGVASEAINAPTAHLS
eukprot:486553-Amphidinium_carterae.1